MLSDVHVYKQSHGYYRKILWCSGIFRENVVIFRHIPCIPAFRVFTTPLLYALVHLFIYASLSFFSWAFGVVLWEICTLGKNISCRLLDSHRASSEYRSRQLAKLFFSKNVLTKNWKKNVLRHKFVHHCFLSSCILLFV
jgi:hypothetical protein